MKPVLLIDFGSTYTKITAVDVDSEEILGTAQSYTTIETDIINGLNNALAILREKIGDIQFAEQYACSSAAGGLRMVAIGLVPDLTAKAARQASLGAGAKVIKTYSYELTEGDLREIDEINPDICLLTGGTDVHLVMVDLRNSEMDGQQGEDLLAACGITINRNTVPFDPRPASVASGLRIGTSALATCGFGPKEYEEVADIIGTALAAGPSADVTALKARVDKLAEDFPLYPDLDQIH